MLGKKTGMKQIKMLILWFVFGVRILFWDFPSGSVGKEFACNAGDTGDIGLIPGLGRSPGGENDNPLHYPCRKTPRIEEPVRLLSMGFSRQEYWSGLPFPPSEDLPYPGKGLA